MAEHVYHWKHGWIPLDHTAAIEKANGDKAEASKMLADAHAPDAGIRNRRDVAAAIKDIHNVPREHRAQPRAQIINAAMEHKSTDLLPDSSKPDYSPKSTHTLSARQYEAMRPQNMWTTARREQILKELNATPEGKVLADTLGRFQDGGSIARLRTVIDKRIRGEEVPAMSAARADAVLGAIRNAPSGWAPKTLYRGISINGSYETVASRYQAGGTLDLSISSFSSDRKVAVAFQAPNGKRKETKVMIELVGGNVKALPIQNLPKDQRLFREKEWVTAGRYRIVSVKRSPSGSVLMRVEQVSGP